MSEVVVRNVSKSFRPEWKANDNVSLTIHDGELFVIVGAAGSGKTTLLRTIAGLETPDAGTVAFDGKDVTVCPPVDRNVAMVSQRDSLWPHLSVRDNLLFGSRLRAAPSFWQRISPFRQRHQSNAEFRELEGRAEELAYCLKIAPLLDRRPHELSGGESQRVAIARALMRRPNVLLLDEPFAYLDLPGRRQLTRDLMCLQKQLQVTTIVVSHDQEDAFTMADRMAVFVHGQVVQVGLPAAICQRPLNWEIARFLGDPPMNLFRGRLVQKDERTRFVGAGWSVGWSGPHGSDWIGGEAILGFRPEDADLLDLSDGSDSSFAVFHGNEIQLETFHRAGGLARVTIGDNDAFMIFARIDKSDAKETRIRVAVPVERIVFFEVSDQPNRRPDAQ